MRSFILTMGLMATTALPAADLTLNIQGVETSGGKLRVGLFQKEENFPEGKPAEGLGKEFDPTGAQMELVWDKLPAGTYALALYQDKNNNKKLDKNFWGMPKELYALSGGKSRPNFKSAQFELPETGLRLELKLR